MNKLKNPTESISLYLENFKKDTRYFQADEAIKKLFDKFPENKNIEEILLKVCVINDLYSTNILGTYKMAERIKNIDVDKYFLSNDLSAVEEIAYGHKIKRKDSEKEMIFYSFATKYCHWHKPSVYPIYDGFVHK